MKSKKAFFHLPGLFEFYELYKSFLPVFFENREYFYEWCEIGSIYGAPNDCIWGGGRIENESQDETEVLSLMRKYGISSRLAFSNSLIEKEHIEDRRCNRLCRLFEKNEGSPNGVIVHSDLLLNHLRTQYPGLYFVSSTTKVQTDFNDFINEVNREEFSYVVPDFRLNKCMDKLNGLSDSQKSKVEFLCNECCDFGCADRKKCYEDVSRKALGMESIHSCKHLGKSGGYSFSLAMNNPGFISVKDIENTYLPMGFENFKIEGRGLGSALVLEFLLYYMTKPEYHIHVREKIYLDNMLDLF